MISAPARLSRDHFALSIAQEDKNATVSFEDIAVIILNHRQITITHPVLSACSEYGIALFSTAENGLPNGVFLPFSAFSRTSKMLRLQLNVAKPIAKRAWASIVKAKIINQAKTLALMGKNADRLFVMSEKVRSADADNMESQAASFYFAELFGDHFNRRNENAINSALNFGYAIFRGAIARNLVAHGLNPELGLFHHSELNAFNLADDLIEPFRPIVDLWVAKEIFAKNRSFNAPEKAALVTLLNADVQMSNGKTAAINAIDFVVESLVRLYANKEEILEAPILLGTEAHFVES
ncbi:MAG: type II CRISPR-associated endonuclease Cas1 [Helicobacteraceae bacterium]|jgi:CRISPR-associated protein Cas1|nr:type II CRISPR-associated endonuclease Cas1 [Helicobacteraceae bacterium]